jgi:hypothetical protein
MFAIMSAVTCKQAISINSALETKKVRRKPLGTFLLIDIDVPILERWGDHR